MEKEDKLPEEYKTSEEILKEAGAEPQIIEKELTYEEQTEKDFHKNPIDEEVEEWGW